MHMLLIVFRSSLEQDILQVLETLQVSGFTDLPRVFGMGEAGSAFSSFTWPGSNSMILAGLEERQARAVVAGLRELRDRSTRAQSGARVPLHVFVLPCDQAI